MISPKNLIISLRLLCFIVLKYRLKHSLVKFRNPIPIFKKGRILALNIKRNGMKQRAFFTELTFTFFLRIFYCFQKEAASCNDTNPDVHFHLTIEFFRLDIKSKA